MGYKKHFKEELNNEKTRYFVLDTNGGIKHGDIDFIKYTWSRSKYNKVSEGDVFLCRRPGKASETKDFYFFGAAKIGHISDIGTKEDKKRVSADLTKVYPFPEYLHKKDPALDSFRWKWKKRGNTWLYFFNQYGMNEITKEDFEGILNLAEESLEIDEEYDADLAKVTTQNIQNENYYADDEVAVSSKRTKQSVISNKVKANYKNQCAVCKLSTKAFLIGSHIVPWSKNKDIRLDPSNVICLCSLHDKAFDAGYITIDDNYKLIVSDVVKEDPMLNSQLKQYIGKKLHLPSAIELKPKKEYLNYHRTTVFEKFFK